MKTNVFLAVGAAALLLTGLAARAEIKVTVDHRENSEASSDFKFKKVPSPAKDDAASKATFTIVDGEKDDNGGELEKVHDGKLPSEEDEPAENFFFNAGTEGGRIKVSFEKPITIKQINTYSWHPNTRGPQVYKVYGSDGTGDSFNAKPKRGTDPEKCGWKLIASVDTRPKNGDPGGQYGVSISNTDGPIGKYEHLLFDMSRTEADDDFGNTFYSEIDVVEQK
jgi:hypothetical protein